MNLDGWWRRTHATKIIVDANLLLLYFVGEFDRRQIKRFKRTDKYRPEDHAALTRFLARFQRIVTTPHILAEVSNLAGQLAEPARTGVMNSLAAGVARLEELHASAATLAADGAFIRFGITDAGVLHHGRERHLVLTDDRRLSQYLQHQGVDAVNFEQVVLYESAP